MWDPYAEFETATLSNGLTIHVAHWLGRPWEVMGFLIHSGAEHDPVGLEGLSHFVEHVVSENASICPKTLSALLENCGGKIALGLTDFPCTKYQFFAPTDNAILSQVLSVFGQMLFSAKLEKGIEKERQVILSEFREHFPFKFRLDLETRRHKMVFAGFWLERMVRPLGSPESISKISQHELQLYYDEHYTPANVSIVAVGGLILQEVVQLLSQSPFAISKQGLRTPLPEPVTEIAPPIENRYIFQLSNHILMPTPLEVGEYRSFAAIPGNISVYALNLFCDMFDEVLMDEIRENRAWTYHIKSSYSNYRGFYEFSIHCAALAVKALYEIETLIEICIASMNDRQDLFEKAKRSALASNLMLDSTGSGVCDVALSDLAIWQKIVSLAEYSENIKEVTMDDICHLVKRLKPERRWTLITQP